MQVLISVLSKQGSRERNEDACGYWGDNGPVCCVLADGAGGHEGGHVASRTAVACVLDAFAHYPESSPARVFELIEQANQAVLQGQREEPALESMRATLVVLTFDPVQRQVSWGHIGDSRLYYFRSGALLARTKDHSLFQSMVDAGFAKPRDEGRAPESTVLVASLGSEDGFVPEVLDGSYAVQPGDAFLLCSDGFWEHFGDRELEQTLSDSATPQEWLATLEERLIAINKPGQDNYSAIAIWCERAARGF